MKVNGCNSPTFSGAKIYNSKLLKKSAEYAYKNSATFCAATTLVLSTFVRPLAIMATPKADKEDKKYAIIKSLASSFVNFGLTYLITKPISCALENIDKSPEKFLSDKTIKNLSDSSSNLHFSKKYQFAMQLFKLGLMSFIAMPKSALTTALIPKIASLFSKSKKKPEVNQNKFLNLQEYKNKTNKNNINFKGKSYDNGIEALSKGISVVLNQKPVHSLADKFYKKNFEQGMMFLTDIILTGAFVNRTKKSKKIEEERKSPLIYNSILSTAFSILSSFTLDKMIDKPYQKFIENFKNANKNSPNIAQQLEGLEIGKQALIMGGVYYILIPILSTFLADKIKNLKNNVKQNDKINEKFRNN